MNEPHVIVTTTSDDPACAPAMARRLAEAWPKETIPEFTPMSWASLTEGSAGAFDAVVIVAHARRCPSLVMPLLAELEETGTPVLALLDDQPAPDDPYTFGGALALGPEQDDVACATALLGLMYRQREIDRLGREVSVTRRHHGGLRSEISRMQEDLQLAAMVQREFLPRELPTLHGIQFGALWRPAHWVSGDLYDVIRLDEDHVGMFVADSIGHGVPAALMTMVICRALTVKEVEDHSYRLIPPAEVLTRLNSHLICRRGRTTRFATAVYAIINCRTRTLTIAGAGHPPPILLRANGETEMIDTPGGLLGVFADGEYEQVERRINPGDRLLLYSDGFEQAFPGADAEDRKIDLTRYRTEFESLREAHHATEMIEQITHRLDGEAGSLHQADDLTLVCMSAAQDVETPDRKVNTAKRRNGETIASR